MIHDNQIQQSLTKLPSESDISKLLTISFVGAPNVGKSTLTNAIFGEKVTICSAKAHTTNQTIRAIKNIGNTQLVLLDHKGFVNRVWTSSLELGMKACVVIDASRPYQHDIKAYIKMLLQQEINFTIIVNKCDTVKKKDLFELATAIQALGYTDQIWFVSAILQKGITALLQYLIGQAESSPWLYGRGGLPTDRRAEQRTRLEQCIREKIFHTTSLEVPYLTKIQIVKLIVGRGFWRAKVNIRCSKLSHKPILIGKHASVIKKIGEAARAELSFRWGRGDLFLEVI